MRKLTITLIGCCWAGLVLATGITSTQAKTAVGNWVKRRPAAHMTATFTAGDSAVETFTDGGTNLFHIVSLANGGFVVTSTDDRIWPIIAFSDHGRVEPDDRNPLWVMLKRDLAGRLAALAEPTLPRVTATAATTTGAAGTSASVAEWADLLSAAPKTATAVFSASAGRSTLSDVRVAPLVESKWSQSKVGSQNCYNYYTPYDSTLKCNLVCGCVATAGAQLMRYWSYPTASVAAKSYKCAVFNKKEKYTMKGGYYDWSLMDLEPASDLADDHRQAIGKLCYDVGVASQMQWGYYSGGSKEDSSGAGPHALARALTEAFGYRNARTYSTDGESSISSEVMERTLFANFDAGCPVLLSISGNGGHEIVADGYGVDSGNYYTHLNMGWSGSSDAWYNLPDIGTYYQFSIVNIVIYNVFTDKTGELLTGRVLDTSGNPISGCTVAAGSATATTDAQGIYALNVVGDATYTVTASASGYASSELSVYVPKSVSDQVADYGPGGSSWYPDTATAGNSWGNDFTLSVAEVVPPQSWFDQYPGLLEELGTSDLSVAAKKPSPGSDSQGKTAADGSALLVWMDYVCGTNPQDTDSKFKALISLTNGVPKIEWSPKLSEAETKLRKYVIGGKTSLLVEDWTPVAAGQEGEYNFFNVSVQMQ